MGESSALEVVLEVTKIELDRLEQAMQHSQAQLFQAKQTEQQLLQYRQSYPSLAGVVSAGQLQRNHAFLNQIDQSIAQQQQSYPQWQEKIEQQRLQWQQKQQRYKGIERLVALDKERAELKALQQAERDADDHAVLRALVQKR